jgi:hypothetical protein
MSFNELTSVEQTLIQKFSGVNLNAAAPFSPLGRAAREGRRRSLRIVPSRGLDSDQSPDSPRTRSSGYSDWRVYSV